MLRQTQRNRRNNSEKVQKNRKIFFVKNDPKLNKKHLPALKSPRGAILGILEAILDQNRILKKKVVKICQKSAKMPQNRDF